MKKKHYSLKIKKSFLYNVLSILIISLVLVSAWQIDKIQGNTLYVYDDFNGNTVNQSLWTNSSGTSSDGYGNVTVHDGFMEVWAGIDSGDAGNTFRIATSNNFSDRNLIENLTIRVQAIPETANPTSLQTSVTFSVWRTAVFNFSINAAAQDDSVWTIIRNSSGGSDSWAVYNDGVWNLTFSGANNDIYFLSTVNNVGSTFNSKIRVHYLNFSTRPTNPNTTLYTIGNGSLQFSTYLSFEANATRSVPYFNVSFFNATLNVWNSTSDLVNVTTNLMTGNSSNYTSFNTTGLGLGLHKWNVISCLNDTGVIKCLPADKNYTFFYGAVNNSDVFNATTLVGNIEGYITNLSTPSGFAVASANLIWNQTSYPGTVSLVGGNYILTRALTIPVSGTKSFLWEVNFNTGFQQNISSYTQVVGTPLADNCGSFTYPVFNFTLYDEDTRGRINGTIELLINFLNQDRSLVVGNFNTSYTITETSPNARVCLQQINTTYSLDYQAKYYSNVSYSTEYKFARAITLTNTSSVNTVGLYDLLDSRSTPFVITVQNPDLSVIQDAIVDIQREYVPINQFISVESPITDTYGSTVAHLVSREVYYNFVVSKNGTLLGTFNRYLVQCQNEVTGDCRIDLNLIQTTNNIEDFENYGNISATYTWTQNNRTLLLDFFSTDGATHKVAWNITKLDNYGNNTICTNSLIGTTGQFICTIPHSYGNSSIISDLYSDNIFLGSSQFNLGQTSSDIFGGTRVILAMLMYTTISLLLFGHPIMMIVGSILGMAFAIGFHLVDGGSFIGNSSIFLWFVISGIIIIYYMRNKV